MKNETYGQSMDARSMQSQSMQSCGQNCDKLPGFVSSHIPRICYRMTSVFLRAIWHEKAKFRRLVIARATTDYVRKN